MGNQIYFGGYLTGGCVVFLTFWFMLTISDTKKYAPFVILLGFGANCFADCLVFSLCETYDIW